MGQQKTKRYFGTDGIRGKVGEEPINPEFILKLGWAVGCVLGESVGRKKVIIGKDTRISGYMFESALQAGLSAAGVDIRLLGPMPTPAIAYLTRTLHAQAGIVISASHNPYYDNGIKFFSASGRKLPDDLEFAIEAMLDEPMTTVESAKLGKAERVVDAGGRYIEYCKSTIPSVIDLKGLKIVVDCAHGATYHVTPAVFSELGANVVRIGADPNGLNINKGCGSTHPEALVKEVIAKRADVGIALDGDGDRVIMVDDKGEVLDGDELLYIIAASRQARLGIVEPVVGTLMSNLGLEHALERLGTSLHRANVGDRYVMEMLTAHGWNLGGESSGHIICLDKSTTGDGTVAALQVITAMIQKGCSLYELKQGMSKYPQCLINVRTERKFDFASSDIVNKTKIDVETKLSNKGRVLLRASGTEPVIRVMVEGENEGLVYETAQQLAEAVKQGYKLLN